MVQEMLFDYAIGELDPVRHEDVKIEISKSKSLQDELARIQTGLGYFKNMQDLKISTLLIEDIKSEKSYFQQIKNSLSVSQWPPIVKWTIEAFAIIFAVVFLTILTPWDRMKEFVFRESQTELILAEVTKKTSVDTVAPNDAKKIADAYEDEETPTIPVVAATPPPTAPPVAPVANVKVVQTKKQLPPVEESKKQGFVYRGTASVINALAGSLKLKDKIVEFGGRKAGEVELGWKRNQGDYYFHFTIPESKYEELQEYIKTLGDLKMSRDPHPRIMPNGIIRIILTAEESQN